MRDIHGTHHGIEKEEHSPERVEGGSKASMALTAEPVREKFPRRQITKNLPPRAFRNSTFTLMALTLSACGGGDGDGDGTSSSVGAGNFSASGNLVKGPVSEATVFVDYNGDGEFTEGEPSALTDSNGSYSFDNLRDNQSYEVIALLEGAVDESSGRVLSGGLVFKSTTDASVITPITTMITDQEGVSPERLIEVLGLSGVENFDPMNFNPYADDVDPADALLVEQTAQKVMTVIETFTTVLEASGIESSQAYSQALKAVSDQAQNSELEVGGLLASSSIDTILTAAINNDAVKTQVSDTETLKLALN